MLTLDSIGLANSTDKASNLHGYLPLYDFLLARYRDEPINLLEIGFQFGCSLRTWREYFKRALILGIDVVHNGLSFPASDGIALQIGDAYSHDMLTRLGNMQFDVMLDDGPHHLANQLFFCQFYVPMLAPGGIAIVEDIESPKHLPQLREAVPEGFQSCSVDLRKEGGLPDSVLLLVWRG